MKRNVGIETLRILSMFMVLLLHYNLHSGVNSLNNFNYQISYFLEALCACAVNCYVLISGYFLCKSKTSTKKLLRILSPVWFYSITIYIVGSIQLGTFLPITRAIKFIFPVSFGAYWFVLCYVLLYILSPYLNKIIENSNQKDHKKLIVIMLVVSFLSSVLNNINIHYNMIDTTNGYGIIWFITLYFVASYIREYHLEKDFSKYKLLIIYIFSTVLAFLSHILISYLNNNEILLFGYRFNETIFMKYNSVFIFINSITLFLFFVQLKIKIKWLQKTILFIAPLTFAVYIIHCHPMIFGALFKRILNAPKYIYSNQYFFVMVVACIGLFIICCIVEKIRQIIFQKIKKLLFLMKSRIIK